VLDSYGENKLFKAFGVKEPTPAQYRTFGFKLHAHRNAVRLNSEALLRAYPGLFSSDFVRLITDHDVSKFRHPQLGSYTLKYCTPKNKMTPAIKKVIKHGWIHHLLSNGHHPEYWRNKGDINLMPMDYMGEMACDLGSFERQFAEKNVIEWWEANKATWADFDYDHSETISDFLHKIQFDIRNFARL
jgi:hypothetical protein